MPDLLRPVLLLPRLQRVTGHMAEIIGGKASEAGVHGWTGPEAVVPFLLLFWVAEGGALVGFAVGG
jgi:hypothetical protein